MNNNNNYYEKQEKIKEYARNRYHSANGEIRKSKRTLWKKTKKGCNKK